MNMKTVTRTIGERTALSLTAGALALLRQSGRAVLVLLLLLITSATAWAQTSASYRAYNTSTHAFETLTANSCTAVTSGTTTMSNGWYVVSSNVTISTRIKRTLTSFVF